MSRWVNACNLWIHALGLHCNGDIKIIAAGSDTKNLTAYVISYATKKQGRTYHMSALLAKTREQAERYTEPGVAVTADKLLVKLINMANSRQEVGGPMVILQLMGWGPLLCSHTPKTVYLADVIRVLRNFVFKGLKFLTTYISLPICETTYA